MGSGKSASRRSSAAALRKADLVALFHLPINDVARRLGICVTVLKSRCREFGIQRWPYRKVKKLDNLIGALAKDGGAGAELLVELKDCREYLLANPNSNAHNTLGKIKAAKKGKRAGASKAAKPAPGPPAAPPAARPEPGASLARSDSGRSSDTTAAGGAGSVQSLPSAGGPAAPAVVAPLHGLLHAQQAYAQMYAAQMKLHGQPPPPYPAWHPMLMSQLAYPTWTPRGLGAPAAAGAGGAAFPVPAAAAARAAKAANGS